MKALSIKQPWASLICVPREDNPLLGIKDIENRTWRTNFRERIYIHASAKSAGDFLSLLTNKQLNHVVCDLENYKTFETSLEYSAIIGEVDIIDCVINHESIWAEKTDFSQEDPQSIWNWVLANPVLYDKPILNVKGKLSFWEPDTDIVECIGCSKKFDAEFMEEDDEGEKFCDECWEELSPVMIKETKECNDRDKLAEFGKVVTICQSVYNYEFLITDGFSQNARNTFSCMEVCMEIAKDYPYVKKCITEDNKFHLILTKEKK